MPLLTLAHSPDPDDVFMWWPLGSESEPPVFDTHGFRFHPIAEDIQQLNRRAITSGDLDITAVSIHTYPHIKDRYRLTSCAGSFGDGYGPKLVVRADRRGRVADPLAFVADPSTLVAIPGVNTTAFLVLRVLVGREFRFVELPFDEIPGAVQRGEAAAGLLIHDAQLTYARHDLAELLDIGLRWRDAKGLPLPLGGNAVRRDLDERFGPGALEAVGRLLCRSIAHALDHRREGMERIGARYPELDSSTLDRYLSMYVSQRTLDPGPDGRRAIAELLALGRSSGLSPDAGPLDLLECGPLAQGPRGD
ncbi:MAG TPA: ABC transporter substrate-binding protein [Phycisphaerales bacterium]|nr:ABC transporter substrate-binding protein [Phycisphaerales bacterium]